MSENNAAKIGMEVKRFMETHPNATPVHIYKIVSILVAHEVERIGISHLADQRLAEVYVDADKPKTEPAQSPYISGRMTTVVDYDHFHALLDAARVCIAHGGVGQAGSPHEILRAAVANFENIPHAPMEPRT